jgi:hypothetical protein
MIVLARNFGQLGNRLCLSAHLIAAAREYGVTFLNPSFAEYAQYFTATFDDLWCRYPALESTPAPGAALRNRSPSRFRRKLAYHSVYLGTRVMTHLRMNRYPAHIIQLRGEQTCDLSGDLFRELATSRRPLLLSGWNFRSRHLVDKHIEAIREHFQIIPEHRQSVDRLIGPLRQKADRLIGIHIRHGDYAQWEGGKYFYPVADYVAIMRRIRERLPNQRIVFLVCGNAIMNRDDFGDLNVHFGTGHLIEDLYAFADTDYLIGPPSTYTRWASLYGGVPLEHVEHLDQELKLSGLQADLSHVA